MLKKTVGSVLQAIGNTPRDPNFCREIPIKNTYRVQNLVKSIHSGGQP
jgi:hypothetical protein